MSGVRSHALRGEWGGWLGGALARVGEGGRVRDVAGSAPALRCKDDGEGFREGRGLIPRLIERDGWRCARR